MTRIVATAISTVERTNTHIRLDLGVDIRFTGDDLLQGQTGTAKFEIECLLWDDDWVYNDFIDGKQVILQPESIQELTGVNILFDLSWAELREKEPWNESKIEVFGEFTLKKDNKKLGPSVNGINWRIDLPDIYY
jgi:hypothetical protein